MNNQPFYQETLAMLDCVSKHDFDRLAAICDDDFGIVDLNPEGKNVIVEDRAGWENWFRTLFATLQTMQAETYSEIHQYQALQHDTMGYCVVNFNQFLVVGGQKHRFNCVSTIIWKKVGDAWKESRWHVSLIDRELMA
ncbi:MAG: nuclear transport factor 2 family protein [Cytophagales bacterium]|jgi:ketosteroid isomerase-like protein|nr:nuclear transport factor 2 family protein [Cytophagales bacterium]